MKPFVPSAKDKKKNRHSESVYIQLYEHIKKEILHGAMQPGEHLPSLRQLAADSRISLTTVSAAYEQLLTEGYITSRPRSGYRVAAIPALAPLRESRQQTSFDLAQYEPTENTYLYDLDAFDFGKWKKCTVRVLNDYRKLLMFESDVQGEEALRAQIARYVYDARGVSTRPERIVIGAGTQQLTAHLCRILKQMDINYICTEEPGYLPIQKIFADNGFPSQHIPVGTDGIAIEKLPVNVRSAVYVSPANQFPTGAVMPIARRHRLLAWAKENRSIILEDDYDSELRYFGRPIPALQGMDRSDCVVYLGSFSSTLFPSIRISYMVLPEQMSAIFSCIKGDYTQTCSKLEQLTLALFMEEGSYRTNIRKVRTLYARKLQTALKAFAAYGEGLLTTRDTKSGINIFLTVRSGADARSLCEQAASLGLRVEPLETFRPRTKETATPAHPQETQEKRYLIFYYNQIPLPDIDTAIHALARLWRRHAILQ